ncbi:MAG: LuxR C-terminal-related transcriptional regulator [Nocardioides sp.]|nr:LuxR C-terminal-related transcriptional regulator [Nocardioides sp.]
MSSSEPEAEMRSLSTQLPVRWVVLSQRPRGSDWGAALDGGACAVVSGSTRLDEIVTLVRQVVAGRDVMGEAEREELVATWQRVRVESKRRTELLASLSPRERAVLEDLDAGRPVTTIAAASGVSVATVRTQVRGILRKLDVSSQLAAVALLRDVLDRSPMLPRDVAAGRPDHP